jgi:hypothetical protein
MCTASKGNRYLRFLVNNFRHPYSEARNKVQKSAIVSTIIDKVKQASPKSGGFIKYEDGNWWEVDDAFAREKIGGLFRDFLHTQYRSSTKAKLARRKVKTDQPQSSSADDYHFDSSSNSSSISPPQQDENFSMNKEVPVDCSTFHKTIVPAYNDHPLFSKPADSLHQSTQEQYSDLLSGYGYGLLREVVLNSTAVGPRICFEASGTPYSGLSDWTETNVVLDDFPDDISDIFDDDINHYDGRT